MNNILHMIETTGPGGAEKMLMSLAHGLDADCIGSLVCLRKDGWLRERLEMLGVETVIIPQMRTIDLRLCMVCIRAKPVSW